MGEASATRESLTATGVVEHTIQRLLEHPALFAYGALAIGMGFGLIRHRGSARDVIELLALAGVMAAWIPVWIRRRAVDPGGRAPMTIALGLGGSLLLGRLLAFDMGFAILSLSLLAQYFLLLPFSVAVLCGIPPAIGSEYSHRLAVLADPTGYPWAIAVVRTLALAAIGVSIKVLTLQMEERSRLQASLVSAERRTGMLEERQRLAREIHDTLAQGFAGIVVHLERAEQIDSLVGSPAKPHVELARSVAREGLEDARRMLAALRPEILEQRGLTEALGRVCGDWTRRTGIPATLSVTGAASALHPDIELTVLRAVQESLTNIQRHAAAQSAAVTLSYMEDVLVLDVQDDGRGIASSMTVGPGFGLSGMRERAERLAGSFSIEGLPGEGTTIRISLPVIRPGDRVAEAGGPAA
jgi:signal transduction histidine kinase